MPSPALARTAEKLVQATSIIIKQFELPSDNRALAIGEYQLVFATAEYFAKNKRACFYPKVTIDFVLDGTQAHCHVPLLISSYGFSTYRGS